MKAAARRGNLDHRSGTGGVVVVPQRFTLPAPRRIVLVQDETHLDPHGHPIAVVRTVHRADTTRLADTYHPHT